MSAHLSKEPLDLASLIAHTEDPAAGALAIFVGTVREENDGRDDVIGMTYEAAEGLVDKALSAIESEAIARFFVRHCRIVHRIGYLGLGEASVIIVVRSAHRAEAFDALRYAIEALKARAPIWKLEHYRDGTAGHLGGISLCAHEKRAT